MSTKKFTTRHGIDANYQDVVSANNVSTNTLTALVSTGTAPLSITSTTKVDNLNVDLLDSYHAAISNTANTVVVRDANTFISLNGIYMNSSEGLKRIAWNDTYSTYDMQLLDGVTLQVGQESHIYGRATENIQNGQVVMFAGAQGDGLLLRVANTQISGFEPKWIVGVATQTIPQNNWGYVTWFGKVSDLNTFNYSLGDILYVNNSVAGGLSNTKPTAPNYSITMAAVVRVATSAGANNGILMVRPDFGSKLNELHDVRILNASANDVLIYSSTNTRWENKTQSEIISGDSDKLDGQHGSYYTGYTDTANTNNLIYTNDAISSNVSLLQGVDNTQNTNISAATTSAQAAFTHANAAFSSSNTKFSSSGGTITGDVVITGNVAVQGTTTTLDVDTITVEDKNITLANVAIPTDITADGAGLTVLGATNKTWNWVDATDSWTSSENINLVTGKTYKINGTDVLTSTTLGSGVTSSSLTSVGTLTNLTVTNPISGSITGSANNSNYLNGNNSSYFTNASNISSGTLSNDRLSSIPNSSLANSSVTVNGTEIFLGSSGSITAGGATITDDTSTNATRYVMLGTATSGSYTVANTSSTKLSFNPSTGTLSINGTVSATTFSGSGASLTSLPAANLSGIIPTGVLGSSSLYIGTTAVALNRASSSLSLTGVSIDGNAGTVTNGVYTSRTISTTSPISGGGDLSANRTLSLASGYGDTQNPYASKTANYFLAAPNGTAGVPTFRAIVAADIPTLNQNTTGSSGSVANALTIGTGLSGTSYNGSAATTIAVNYGTTSTTACVGNDARLSDTRNTTNSVTFNNAGTGAASGTTFNGSSAVTISYNTVGAAASGHTHNYAGSASAGGAATSLLNFTTTTTTDIGAENSTSGIGYISGISLLGQPDGALYSHVYSAAWKHQIYGDFRTGQIALRGKNNDTWQAWRTVLDSSNYTSYSPSLTGSGASGTWGINITGSAGSASTVTVNYNNNSASTYQMLWGSGNSVYGTAEIYCNPSTDYLYSGSFYCGNWFRSSGETGWYNESYGGGIHMSDATWVRVYNNKQFYSQNYIQSDSSLRAPIFYDSNNTGYYIDPTSTTSIRTAGDWRSDSSGWTGEFSGKIQYHSNHWYFQAADQWIFRNSGGSNVFYVNQSGNTYTPIVYDSNNTGYYWDGASTSKWNESNQDGWHTFNNYGLGITGTYDSYRLQTVFAMGSGYRMAADGLSTSDMYGVAWSHPNAGALGGANNLNDHGLLIINNGGFRAAISSRAVFSADVRGTLFYDYNNTGYYVDPNGTSQCSRINCDNMFYGNGNWSYFTGFYDTNDTGYYCDPNSYSSFVTLRCHGNELYIRGGSPTLRFEDTDEQCATLHNNSNLLYILRHNSYTVGWSTVGSGWWPMTLNLTNNDVSWGGNITAAYNVTAYASDKRLKENIQEIPNAIEKIKKIRGVTFDWNDKADEVGFKPPTKFNDVGVIAQEIEEVLPQVVTLAPFDMWTPDPGLDYTEEELKNTGKSRSGENYKTVQYDRVVPLLIQAIKEQQIQIEQQSIELNKLKSLLKVE